MISAVIRAGGNLEALAVTLAGLVPAVAEGILRDAVIVDDGTVPGVQDLAEAAGAAYVAVNGDDTLGEDAMVDDALGGGPWRAGAGVVKGPWFLLLAAGDLPGPNWIPALERFIRRARGDGAAPDIALFPGADAGGLRGLAGALATRVTRRHALVAGMIVPRSVIQKGDAGGARLQRLSVKLERHADR
ncbi:hypothetical protein [Chelatococcus asaccharovorans]|uniref:hypothetical protein n=1 Tax=Chelatococcus asaccharovorans TaxID=28210 RepID=UPI00224C65BD|nr:hypothetical protein [Chelatococcus asaccharovorans]CAH1669608.1 conserved hypothetical protein [Chelatococcus asaccharovorans]CAH1678934.1 conserved hypothetical protein [Chelatococcus asaccharovorans]